MATMDGSKKRELGKLLNSEKGIMKDSLIVLRETETFAWEHTDRTRWDEKCLGPVTGSDLLVCATESTADRPTRQPVNKFPVAPNLFLTTSFPIMYVAIVDSISPAQPTAFLTDRKILLLAALI